MTPTEALTISRKAALEGLSKELKQLILEAAQMGHSEVAGEIKGDDFLYLETLGYAITHTHYSPDSYISWRSAPMSHLSSNHTKGLTDHHESGIGLTEVALAAHILGDD